MVVKKYFVMFTKGNGSSGDVGIGKIYKDGISSNIDMFPSDPSGSLDDFFLIGFTMNEPRQMLLRNLPVRKQGNFLRQNQAVILPGGYNG